MEVAGTSETRDRQAHILVIDDDQAVRKLIKALLEREGYAVLSASSGEEALDMMDGEGVNLILLDIVMPKVDGYQVFQAIKQQQRWQNLPIIFLSAKAEVPDRGIGLSLGAEDYIEKPFSNDELLAKIKLWLRVKRAETTLQERNRELSALIESSVILTSSLDVQQTLHAIIEIAQQLWTSACTSIMLVNEKGELIVSVHANFPEEWLEDLRLHPLKVGESLAGWVAQHKEVLALSDPLSETRYPYRSAPFARKYGITSYLGIPLLVGQRLIGVLNFNSFQDRFFSPEQIALMTAFAQHAAMAIDKARAYTQVREAKEYLAKLVESSNDAIISADLKGVIRLWNKGAERIYGYLAEEVEGKSIEIIFPQESWDEEVRRVGSMMEEGRGVVFRADRRHKDGRLVPVLITWSLIRDELGSPQEISSIHKDMSELSRMEKQIYESKQKLMAVIDGITDFLYVVDPEFRISQINRPYASYLKRTPQSLVGRICYESLRGQRQPCTDCLVPQILEKASPLRGERKELEENGQERVWGVSAFPVIVERGRVLQIIHQLKDVSEEKWLESQMIQAEKMLSLGHLAAGVAHEINNPLASLSIYAELLRRKERTDEETQKYLAAMEENVERMAKIVRGLLDYSRPTPQHLRLLNLQEVIRKSMGILEGHSLFQDIEISCELAEDLPQVQGDALELEQVFFNLILNAAQSMPRGGHLGIKAQQANGRLLEVSIQDSGSGIPPEHLPRIFDPFFTTKPPGKGTGMGLSVVRRIIENHQGKIWVESELEKGTTFTFSLPISE